MQNLFWGTVKLAITTAGAAAGLVFLERKLRPRLDDPEFELWPELGTGKHHVCDLPLCRVLLMDDANFPAWLVLVPRRRELREVTDLSPSLQAQMWREVAWATTAVQELFAPFKMNIASIGNIVSQLHVHVTGRLEGDLAWPGPCYGAVPPVALTPARAEFMLSALRKALDRLKRDA